MIPSNAICSTNIPGEDLGLDLGMDLGRIWRGSRDKVERIRRGSGDGYWRGSGQDLGSDEGRIRVEHIAWSLRELLADSGAPASYLYFLCDK